MLLEGSGGLGARRASTRRDTARRSGVLRTALQREVVHRGIASWEAGRGSRAPPRRRRRGCRTPLSRTGEGFVRGRNAPGGPPAHGRLSCDFGGARFRCAAVAGGGFVARAGDALVRSGERWVLPRSWWVPGVGGQPGGFVAHHHRRDQHDSPQRRCRRDHHEPCRPPPGARRSDRSGDHAESELTQPAPRFRRCLRVRGTCRCLGCGRVARSDDAARSGDATPSNDTAALRPTVARSCGRGLAGFVRVTVRPATVHRDSPSCHTVRDSPHRLTRCRPPGTLRPSAPPPVRVVGRFRPSARASSR